MKPLPLLIPLSKQSCKLSYRFIIFAAIYRHDIAPVCFFCSAAIDLEVSTEKSNVFFFELKP